ncbi:MAG TPA: type I-B CRISPR-associated protein Cas8b1/Cst1 [Bacteroidota bacterium]|nr:type I-B CRISPR-associated protein Cas8b1/Cst1 [Bacteroidota bacterium]
MKIYPADWLTNAGILGFLRLQKLRGFEYDLSKGYIEVEAEQLDRFEETYFSYALMKGFGFFFRFDSLKKLQKLLGEELHTQLQDEFRELIQSSANNVEANWQRFEETITSVAQQVDGLALLTKKAIEAKSPGDPKAEKKVNRITRGVDKDAEKLVKQLIDKRYNYITTQLKRFYFNKAIVGNYSLTGKNRKTAFAKEYVKPAILTLLNKKTTSSVTCRLCGQKTVEISDWNEVNEFFGEGMFAPIGVTLGFKNFFYNMQPDLVMCEVCELILLCSWAGFTEIPWRFRDEVNDTEFIFVNVPNLELLMEENEKLQNLYETSALDLQGTIYEEILYDLFVKEKEKKSEWALQNVLFVEIKPVPRKDQGKPNFRYFHVGRDIAQLFKDESAIIQARGIKGRIYTRRNKENPRNSVFVHARRDTVRRVLSRDSLYPLCYAAIRDQIDNPSFFNTQNAFSLAVLSGIRTNIWMKYKKGESPMESGHIYHILKGFREAGEYLGQGIQYEDRKRKSYRLISLIRTGKIADFYEALLRLYVSQNKAIPDDLVSILNAADAIEPEAKAYAFMSGFLRQQQAEITESAEAKAEKTS